MEFPARSAEMSPDTFLERVGDNSRELKYRDASCQKGGRRSTERQVPGMRWRYLALPARSRFTQTVEGALQSRQPHGQTWRHPQY
jgi:hypothetical protein